MKSKANLYCVGSLLVLSLNACSSNTAMNNKTSVNDIYETTSNSHVVNETRMVSSFSAIEVSTGVDVTYYPTTEKPYIEVNVDAKNIKNLKTEVINGKLNIYFKKGENIKTNGKAMVVVHGPVVKSIEVEAGAILKIEGAMAVKGTFDIEANSGGSIQINKDITIDGNLDLEASSAGSIRWNNKVSASEANIDVSSAANVKGSTLVIKNKTNLDVSSASKCNISNLTTSSLFIDASSSATATFGGGKTNQITIDASSGARVDVSQITNKGNIIVDKSSGARVNTPEQ